jgi:hypothetical protein
MAKKKRSTSTDAGYVPGEITLVPHNSAGTTGGEIIVYPDTIREDDPDRLERIAREGIKLTYGLVRRLQLLGEITDPKVAGLAWYRTLREDDLRVEPNFRALARQCLEACPQLRDAAGTNFHKLRRLFSKEWHAGRRPR